ncbi:MAG: mercuric ion transport protein [Bermanella sp.]|jgi:mercuric ion transport protein
MQRASFLEIPPRLGVLLAAFGCADCFPALGSLAAVLGLGFLSQFEGLLINQVRRLIAGATLLLAVASTFRYRNYLRGFLAISGPAIVLAVLYPLWAFSWSTPLFYGGLLVMLAVSLLDIFKPAGAARCPT